MSPPLPALSAVPHGAWPVFLVRSLPPGEGGFHMDRHNQPYAKVIASPDDDSWTVDASHEIIEMLVDPYGNRMQSSDSIAISGNDVVDHPGTFNYLVEACDPCEANNYAYDIAGIALSDFITPHFYDASVTPRYAVQLQGEHQTSPPAPSRRIHFVCATGWELEPDPLGQSRQAAAI
jgi:hypothetical protein